jgi:hypothetical protein
MAGSTLVEVKRSIVDNMRAKLPGDWAVGYSWPGDLSATYRTMWLGSATFDQETTTLRANRRRRTETIDLRVAFWALEVDAASDGDSRQETADDACVQAMRALDEWIADEGQLGRPDLVDMAWLIPQSHDVGPTDQGESSLLIATVRFQARLL